MKRVSEKQTHFHGGRAALLKSKFWEYTPKENSLLVQSWAEIQVVRVEQLNA